MSSNTSTVSKGVFMASRILTALLEKPLRGVNDGID